MTARAAMDAAYKAWQRTEMQVPFELDETPDTWPHSPTGGGGLVEPERLTSGAEPCCDPLAGRSDGGPVTAPAAMSAGSAPPCPTVER